MNLFHPFTSFIFTLQEFARELRLLVDAMERMYDVEQQVETRRGWWKNLFRGIMNIPAIWTHTDEKGVKRGLRKSICERHSLDLDETRVQRRHSTHNQAAN